MSSPYLNNPDRILALRVDPRAADRDAQLLAAASALAPGWAGAAPVQISAVGGGITNLLFKLEAAGRPPVLVRVYGDGTEQVIDREAENQLFAALSRAGVAPTYYGRFENGRVESFFTGFRALEPHELGQPARRAAIAARLAEFHALPADPSPPRLWPTLRRWMQTARGLRFEGGDALRYQALDLDRWAAVLRRAERRFHEELAPSSQSRGGQAACRAVLAHNDLLAGNILLNPETGEVRFIDYEYGAPSYAAFDLANHFCEYAGFDADFGRGFPSRALRADFIARYLGPGFSAQDVADFGQVVDFFVVPNHLFWGTWAVIQAACSPIDFDFLGYAALRMKGCALHLEELWGEMADPS